jgi:hypothetical protein
MSTAPDRDELARLARRLETLAEAGGPMFDRMLADFNARTQGTCTRSTFKWLYQSEEPEDLVDRLLEIRDAAAFVPPRSAQDVAAYMARAAEGGSYVDGDYAGRALAHLSRLPPDIAHQLGSGFGQLPCWPPQDEIIAFALAYEPLTSKEQLFEFVRRWFEDEAARRWSMYVALGEMLLGERQAVLKIPELDPIVKNLATGIDVRRAHALVKLRKLVGAPAPHSERSAPKRGKAPRAAPKPTEERVTHPKFGEGVVLRRESSGSGEKVTVRFASGERTILARSLSQSSA